MSPVIHEMTATTVHVGGREGKTSARYDVMLGEGVDVDRLLADLKTLAVGCVMQGEKLIALVLTNLQPRTVAQLLYWRGHSVEVVVGRNRPTFKFQ